MSKKPKSPLFLKDIWRKNTVAYLFLLPSIIMMLLFNAYPIAFSIGAGFTNMMLANITGGYHFIGLDNYVKLLTVYGPDIQRVLLITFLWTAVNVGLQVAIGLAFALFYNSKDLYGRRFHLAIMILPWAIPGLTSTMVWATMFQTTFGAINQLFRTVGFVSYPGPNWLNDQWLAFAAYNIVNTWLAYPFMMTMIIGALQGVSPELYEAAAIDGARSWSRFRHITLPSIRRPLLLATLLTTNTTFQQFNVAWILNQGGPANANEFVMVWAYKNIYTGNFYGLSSAFLGIILVIILIIGFLGIRVSRIAEEAK
jgi:arabinogalactan oligomer/maltooligosaccharide transport system permease protein